MNCAFRLPKAVDCEISLVLHSKVDAKENTLNLYLVSLPPNVLLLDISSRSVRAIIDDRLGSGETVVVSTNCDIDASRARGRKQCRRNGPFCFIVPRDISIL